MVSQGTVTTEYAQTQRNRRLEEDQIISNPLNLLSAVRFSSSAQTTKNRCNNCVTTNVSRQTRPVNEAAKFVVAVEVHRPDEPDDKDAQIHS